MIVLLLVLHLPLTWDLFKPSTQLSLPVWLLLLPCSGPTAYLDDTAGYPLPIDGLVTVGPDGGAFAGRARGAASLTERQGVPLPLCACMRSVPQSLAYTRSPCTPAPLPQATAGPTPLCPSWCG